MVGLGKLKLWRKIPQFQLISSVGWGEERARGNSLMHFLYLADPRLIFVHARVAARKCVVWFRYRR